jgi:predicted nucleic acid-binding protein
MQNLFFDTSALVKRYYDEPGTGVVDSLIESEETKVIVTAITIIEVVSAFRRKYNREDIPEKVVDELLTAFFDEALSDFLIVSTEEALFTHSFDLILEDDLRTLDSLQLSAALAVSEGVEDIAFVSADQELVSVASDRGLETLNPDTDEAEVPTDIEFSS